MTHFSYALIILRGHFLHSQAIYSQKYQLTMDKPETQLVVDIQYGVYTNALTSFSLVPYNASESQVFIIYYYWKELDRIEVSSTYLKLRKGKGSVLETEGGKLNFSGFEGNTQKCGGKLGLGRADLKHLVKGNR